MGQRTITDLQFLKNKWPSAIVARSQVQFFTGGAVKGSTIANLDSLGEGPPERLRIGRSVCYPVHSFVAWLEERMAATAPGGNDMTAARAAKRPRKRRQG